MDREALRKQLVDDLHEMSQVIDYWYTSESIDGLEISLEVDEEEETCLEIYTFSIYMDGDLRFTHGIKDLVGTEDVINGISDFDMKVEIGKMVDTIFETLDI